MADSQRQRHYIVVPSVIVAMPLQADSLATPPDSLLQAAADTARAMVESVLAQDGGEPVEGTVMDDSTNALLEALAEAKKSAPGEVVFGAWHHIVLWIHQATGLSTLVVNDLLWTGIVFVLIWALRWLVLAGVYRRTKDVRMRYQWRKTTSYIAAVIVAFALLRIWLGALGSLATFFGLLSAGVAIALKDPLSNLAGWLFLVWRRPFSPGDRITIRDRTGDVIDQRVFMFTLLEVGTETGAGQSTGRIIHVPNGWVFTDSILNYTKGFLYVWNEIAVVVTFESDWRAAKALLFEVAAEHADALSEDAERKLRRAAQEYLIFYSKLTPTVYTSVLDHGIQLTMRYLVEPRRQRGSEQLIWEAILDAFDERSDIDFAYPTQRVYYHATEGKPPMRPVSGNGGATLPAPPTSDLSHDSPSP